MNEKPSKFKRRYAVAFIAFGVYLSIVGFMTSDSNMGSDISTKIMRWATLAGGAACCIVGSLMLYLRR